MRMEEEPLAGGLPVADTRDVRRAAARLIRGDGWGFTLTVVLGVCAAALALAPPLLVGVIIDRLQHGATLEEIDRLGLALTALAILQVVVSRYSFLVTARFGERTSQRLRRSMVQRVLGLPPRVADRADTGDLLVRATSDVQRVTGILSNAAPEMLVAIVQVVLTFAFIVLLSPPLALTTVLSMVGIVVATRWYLRRANAAYLVEAAAGAELAQSLSATTAGARTVELYGLQQARLEEGARLSDRSRRTQMATLRLRTVLFPAVDSSYVVALVVVMLIGTALYADGALGLGALVAVLLYVRQLGAPMDTVLLWLESLQSGIASFARIEGLAQAPTGEPATASPAGSAIAVEDVSFRYGHGPEVLHAIDLAIEPGEHLVIVGPSGAGKSTLARLLIGYEKPTHGQVTVGGVEASDLPVETRRSHLALVTQEQYVFRDSLRTNLQLSRPAATDDEVRAALRTVGARWVDDLPDGLDTELGDAHDLSGAQAQQVALARVLLADPQTLVLDEATSLLNPGTARDAERALNAVLHGRTVITIAHRLVSASEADRIAVMHEGRIREIGRHDDLLRRQGLYASLWRAWQADAP